MSFTHYFLTAAVTLSLSALAVLELAVLYFLVGAFFELGTRSDWPFKFVAAVVFALLLILFTAHWLYLYDKHPLLIKHTSDWVANHWL